CYIRAILHSLQHDFAAIGRQIEVANVEVCRQVGLLPLSACLQVDEPKILVLNLPRRNTSVRLRGRKAKCRAPRVSVSGGRAGTFGGMRLCRSLPKATPSATLTTRNSNQARKCEPKSWMR